MTEQRISQSLTAALVAAVLLLAGACGGESGGDQSGQTYEDVRGRVVTAAYEGASGAGKEIVVDHESIPGYMQAMRMTARLPEPDTLADRLARGDKIRFALDVRTEGGETALYASAIERLPDSTRLRLPPSASSPTDPMSRSARQPDRSGETGLVNGLRVDPADPPPGSSVGRAYAFVGDAYVQVVYGRPYKRGRVVFGGLVGYDQVWPMGAHQATELMLTGPLRVDGERLESGAYSFFATPGRTSWTIHVNRVLGMHMADRYDPSNDVLTFTVPVEQTDEVIQQHTIDFVPAGAGVDLRIAWDRTRVRIPLRPVQGEAA